MAAVIIKLTDKPSGGVRVSVKFDPPAETDAIATDAQAMAFEMLDRIKKVTEESP